MKITARKDVKDSDLKKQNDTKSLLMEYRSPNFDFSARQMCRLQPWPYLKSVCHYKEGKKREWEKNEGVIGFKLENRREKKNSIPIKLLKVENKIKDLMVVSLHYLGLRMKGREQILW